MALVPTLDSYALLVQVASGAGSAAMHATALAGSGKAWPPKRVLTANLITSAFVGLCISWLLIKSPWQIDPTGIWLASGLTGHVLGPRAAAWIFGGLVKAAQSAPVVGKFVPDVPPEAEPPAPDAAPAPEAPTPPTPEEPHEPE